MSYMFYNCWYNLTELDVSSWDTSSVTNMEGMFSGCGVTSLDLSSWNTSGVMNMTEMFAYSANLVTIYVSELWNTDSVSESSEMFYDCPALVGGEGTLVDSDYVDKTYACIDKAITEGTAGYLTDANASSKELSVTLKQGDWFQSDIKDLFSEAVTKLQFGTYNDIAASDTTLAAAYKASEIFVDEEYKGFIRVFTSGDTVYVLSQGSSKIYANEYSAEMFYGGNGTLGTYLTTIAGLDTVNTSNVTDMSSMFSHCSALTSLDLSSFDTSSVTDMSYMFVNCSSLTSLDLSSFDTSSVEDMSRMFFGISLTSLDLSSFDTSSVTDMSYMFYGSSLTSLDLSNFDTSSVSDMSYMFYKCSSLTSLNLKNWNTSIVTNMGCMFYNCKSLGSLDLSSWDTRAVTTMGVMFKDCYSLNAIYVTDTWSTDNVSSSTAMFEGCTALVGGEGTAYDSSVVDATYACIDKAISEGVKGYLTDANAALLTTGSDFNSVINGKFSDTVTKLQFGTYDAVAASDTTLAELWDASTTYVDIAKAGSIRVFESGGTVYVLSRGSSEIYANPDSSYMFTGYNYGNNSLRSYLKEINGLAAVNTSKVTNMNYMFNNCMVLTTLDISSWNTSSVEKMSNMFNTCSVLAELDLSSWDTGNVKDMSLMFSSCGKLATLNISSWNTSSVTNMSYMFNNCYVLDPLDLSSWNTSGVTNMKSMFSNCKGLASLNLKNWNTSSVDSMYYMFYNCSSLGTLDLSSFDTSSVETMYYMFYGCSSLTSLNLKNWNTSSVTSMGGMFYGCSSLGSLDLSSFETSGVTSMLYMFRDCTSLVTIYVTELWSTDGVNSASLMFSNCSKLTGGEGTTLTTTGNVVDETYAKIDGGTGDEGYFTYGAVLKAGATVNTEYFAGINPTTIVFGKYSDYSDTVGAWTSGTVLDSRSAGTIRGFTSGTTCYVLSLSGKMRLNQDSTQLFRGNAWNNINLTTITGLENLDTSKVKSMAQMFQYCRKLSSLDLSSWDTSNVTTMAYMFDECKALTSLDLSGLETSNVTTMQNMIYSCTSLVTLDVSGFDMSKVTNISFMFAENKKLTTIYGNTWTLTSGAKNTGAMMFSSCEALVGGAGTSYAEYYGYSYEYARIDGGESAPGYFTDPATK